MRSVLELRAAEMKARSAQLATAMDKETKLEAMINSQRVHTDQALQELEGTKYRLSQAEGELKERQAANSAKVAENNELSEELKRVDQEISAQRSAAHKATKNKDALQKRLNVIDQERSDLKKDQESLKTQAVSLEREVELERREIAAARKQAVELQQEMEELRKALDKSADATQRQIAITKLNASMIKTLETDIGGHKQDSMKHRKTLYRLEKEREKFGAEASNANAKFVRRLATLEPPQPPSARTARHAYRPVRRLVCRRPRRSRRSSCAR